MDRDKEKKAADILIKNSFLTTWYDNSAHKILSAINTAASAVEPSGDHYHITGNVKVSRWKQTTHDTLTFARAFFVILAGRIEKISYQ